MAGISWDCYEVSLLIELYNRFPTTYYLQVPEINDLSLLLLSRIEKANIPTDSLSRSAESIIRRMYDVEYCVTGQERCPTQHYQFFSKIVPILYQDERLNNTVAKMARLTTKAQPASSEELFEIWAKAYYKDWNTAIDNQRKANNFVLKKKLSLQPLTQMTVANIKNLLKVVENLRLSYFGMAKLQDGKWILSSSSSDKKFKTVVISGLHYASSFLSDKSKIESLNNSVADESMESHNNSNDTLVSSEQPETLSSVEEYLSKNGLSFIDNREKGGSLWVIGGKEISHHIVELSKRGLKFSYKAEGYKTYRGTPAWYSSSTKKTKQESIKNKQICSVGDDTTDAASDQDPSSSVPKQNSVIENNILLTLKKHFVYGFNIASPIELIRFKAAYESDHNYSCSLGDDEIRDSIKKCGLSYNGKVFVVNQEVKDRIHKLLEDQINYGVIIFYYEEIYQENYGWLNDGHIIDSNMLKGIIGRMFPRYQKKEHYFITQDEHLSEINAIEETLMNIWGDQVLRSITELKGLLPFIPCDKIRYTLSCCQEFIWNSTETYTRKNSFIISTAQIEELTNTVALKCSEKGSVTFEELPLEGVAAENYELSETALHEIVFSYLPNSFSKNGKVISFSNEQHHDTVEAIQQYCKHKETCTLAELQQVMKSVAGSIRNQVVIEAANSVMIRVGRDDYVADERVQFDVHWIDSVLDSFVVGDGIGLKEIYTFGSFPFCGYAWNHFVLESYCRRFSMKFRFECHTPNSENAGAIVRRSSNLSYPDIMAEALARSGVKLVEKNAFDYLISSGYLIRRRFSGINLLLKKAATLREGDI